MRAGAVEIFKNSKVGRSNPDFAHPLNFITAVKCYVSVKSFLESRGSLDIPRTNATVNSKPILCATHEEKFAAWDGFLTAQQTAGNSVRSLSSIRLYKDHFICQRARYISKSLLDL
jgi:hypothetical protein